MGTYLKRLSLAGYRSYDNEFEKNTIDFQKLNIFIGANGAGKSNLVSFLEMISYMMTRGLRSYVSRQGGGNSLMYFGPKNTDQIRGDLLLQDQTGGKTDKYSFALELSATNQLFFAEEKMEYQDQRYSSPYVQDFGVGHFEAGVADSGDVTVRTLRGCLERLKFFHLNDTSNSPRIRSSTNTADGGYLRADGGNLAGFLYRLKKNEAEYAYYQRIVRYVRMILPQFYDFVLEPDENGYISLNWVQNGAEEVFGPHQLSDGALRFIALTTLLLQPSVSAPMTIILDEPEIGLHPYAISVLAREIRMANKTSQIIVSTQSPLLLNHFTCDDIITAEYDPGRQASVLRRHTSDELKEWLNDYSLGELWEKNVLGGLPV